MINYSYAKIVNGKVEYATEPIRKEGYEIINPKPEDFYGEGYQAVVKTPQPEREGYYYTRSVEGVNGIPTEIWTEHKIEREEIDYDGKSI